jgi:hypothetical protein
MSEASSGKARVKLVATYEGGALFVAAFDNGLIEIRDCEREDPSAVRASVNVLPKHAEALAAALREAHTFQTS